MSSIPRSIAILCKFSLGESVVTWVVRAKCFTKPQLAPSGVSEGQITPQWEGYSALGPLIFLSFWN